VHHDNLSTLWNYQVHIDAIQIYSRALDILTRHVEFRHDIHLTRTPNYVTISSSFILHTRWTSAKNDFVIRKSLSETEKDVYCLYNIINGGLSGHGRGKWTLPFEKYTMNSPPSGLGLQWYTELWWHIIALQYLYVTWLMKSRKAVWGLRTQDSSKCRGYHVIISTDCPIHRTLRVPKGDEEIGSTTSCITIY
jgi:hypothetical protein